MVREEKEMVMRIQLRQERIIVDCSIVHSSPPSSLVAHYIVFIALKRTNGIYYKCSIQRELILNKYFHSIVVTTLILHKNFLVSSVVSSSA